MKARTAVGVASALVTLVAATPVFQPIDNGDFSDGLRGWIAAVSDPQNRITVEADPSAGTTFAARMVVNRVSAKPPVWHVNLAWANQGLERLKPRTPYALRFRARASSPRELRLALAQEYRPYRNLGLSSSVQLDRTWRTYTVSFRTDAVFPVPREPDSSGPWLSFVADTLSGETWLTAIRIEPATVPRRRAGAASNVLSTFRPGDSWQGMGRLRAAAMSSPDAGIRLTIPANSTRFIERELPIDLPEEEWKLGLRVWIDEPENLGRLSLLARSAAGMDFAMASVSGLERGWNQIALTRRQFVRPWFTRMRWDSVQTVALRIETNGNGPVTIEPAALEYGGTASARPQVTRLTVEPSESAVTIVCETDTRVRASLAWGLTTRYGGARHSSAAGTKHTFVLRGLTPNQRYHAKVALAGPGSVTGSSGDLEFSTVVPKPLANSASRVSGATGTSGRAVGDDRFDLVLFGVTDPEDVLTVGRTAFSGVQSYQLSSPARNSTADVRRYLDAAASQGLGVFVGFGEEQVKAGDLEYVRSRVRALRDHPAVHGWYAYDEPEVRGVNPEILSAVRDAIRAEDPKHAVTIATSWLGSEYPFRGGFDVAVLDKYPVPYAEPASLVRALERARASGERWQFAFQAYASDIDHRWPSAHPGPGRYPSRDEMRTMAFLALNHGARGLWAFAYHYLNYTPGSEWKWVELTELARELRGLEAVWASREKPSVKVTLASDVALDAGVRTLGGVDYLTIVNGSSRAVRGSVTLANLPGAEPRVVRVDADAPFEPAGRLGGSRLVGSWRPYAVHVYAITRAR